MRKIHLVGTKNSGKTTLVAELVRELTQRGLRVGTIKHTHHQHEFDVPGKDSFRHREAGAAIVGLIGPTMSAAFWETKDKDPTEAGRQLASQFSGCDLVLVEGDQHADALKLEVWRAVTGRKPLARENDSILAVITDDPIETGLPVWPRKDVSQIADRILDLVSDAD